MFFEVDTCAPVRILFRMIEAFSFILGLGFSILVYFRSIKPSEPRLSRRMLYLFFTLIGITGTLFLSGILIAHFLRKWGFIGNH